MCDCHSYNKDVGTAPERVLDPRPFFPWTTRTVCVDACIADEILTLWKNGVFTRCSCCGHSSAFGPEVIIDGESDARKAKDLLAENDPGRNWRVMQYMLTVV